jgi:hypothetical protein
MNNLSWSRSPHGVQKCFHIENSAHGSAEVDKAQPYRITNGAGFVSDIE